MRKRRFKILDLANQEHVVEQFDIEEVKEEHLKEEERNKEGKFRPNVESQLRHRQVEVPHAIYKASGITILGKRIKSLLFSTDIALIKNSNADSIIAVYPFTPQLGIIQSIISVASVPVFVGVGGGTTTGLRSANIALQAELLGAYGVVVNAPMSNDVISAIAKVVDIPVIATVVTELDDWKGKIEAGAKILNVSGGKDTAKIVRKIREEVGEEFPIIATGGDTEEHILKTIEAGANCITYTPPTSGEIFASVMEDYRAKVRGDQRK